MKTSLHLANQTLRIDAGELIGYEVDGHEYIHQKGSPGWRSSDTEMFPVIGPTAEAGFQVQTPKDVAIQDQHGLLREMEYELISETATKAIYKKSYKARTPILNSKYPKKSNKQYLYWTYDFEFTKVFELQPNGLSISFIISGGRDLPYMLGYHPAFKLHTKNPIISTAEKRITLDEVLEVGSRALLVPDCEEITLKDTNELRIKTTGFGNFMLWTEVDNMICIEPITFYPYDVEQRNLHEGFRYLREAEKEFSVHIAAC